MSIKKIYKISFYFVLIYIILAIAFYWVAGEQLHIRRTENASTTPDAMIGQLLKETPIRQKFYASGDQIENITFMFSTYERVNQNTFTVSIEDEQGTILGKTTLSASVLQDNKEYTVAFDPPVKTQRGQALYIIMTSDDAVADVNAFTTWSGKSFSTGRGEIVQEIPEDEKIVVGGTVQDAKLYFEITEAEYLLFGEYYWYIVVAGLLVLIAFCLFVIRAAKKGRSIFVLRVYDAFRRYGYLMKQLVLRDFKSKYKRSVLGIFWSFLNPLLTMIVQYIVFSTLFKSDIDNFVLYLLIGIVCFNFFNEATSIGVHAITGNAALITKVYVPKYIYPLSRVLSSAINLLLSLIPLFIAMLATGAPVNKTLLLLPFGLACLFGLTLGMTMLLSTAMVFFRDTQFLWGVISMLWMYMTPIFYPENIIPSQYITLYKCNPLYHIIRYFRIILMDGVSPEPKAFLLCILVSVIPLLIGIIVFKKNQDKFVINL